MFFVFYTCIIIDDQIMKLKQFAINDTLARTSWRNESAHSNGQKMLHPSQINKNDMSV